MSVRSRWKFGAVLAFVCAPTVALLAQGEVYLLGTPDYQWYAGCFGTASGNLMGYWDRHGLSDFYTGPTGGGIAPLNDLGTNAGIRALWASKAGMDGRPENEPGHMDDYWVNYQSTAADPHAADGRAEHEPDCIGDFIGLSQRKWLNMNGECDGNIDGYSFVYWETNGQRRTNFTPGAGASTPSRDIQSGLREWARYRGYDADVFTQFSDFNPETPPGTGFSFADVKAEIDAGYPLLVFLQDFTQFSRSLAGMPRANPEIHGMMIYGYQEFPEFGVNYVYCRTSWASGDNVYYAWSPSPWVPGPAISLAVRGVIGFRPKPKLRSITRSGNEVSLQWDGPRSELYDARAGTTTVVHRYQIEKTTDLKSGIWTSVSSPTTDLTQTFSDCCDNTTFYRVRLLGPGE